MNFRKGITKVEVEGQSINLKKGFFGEYRIVHPIKDENGKFNWFNFLTGGSWGRLLGIAIVVALLIFIIFAYNNDISSCRNLLSCGATCPKTLPINITNITIIP